MSEETTKKERGSVLFQWKVPEYTKYERSRNWFIAAVIIFLLLLGYAIYTLDLLFAVILILGAVIIGIRLREEPAEIDFIIFDKGVAAGRKFYEWKDVDKFFIIYEPPEVKNLYFNLKGFRARLSIPLVKQNPMQIREALLKYLIEDLEQEQEPLSEGYGRFLKI